MMITINVDLNRLNRKLAGTGYQIARTASNRIRIENEDGIILRYSSSLWAALKAVAPYGVGEKPFLWLLE